MTIIKVRLKILLIFILTAITSSKQLQPYDLSDGQVVSIDEIVERSLDGYYFYYQIQSVSDVKLIFTTQNSQSYYVISTIVSKKQFINHETNQSIFKPYKYKADRGFNQFQELASEETVRGVRTEMSIIKTQLIKKYHQNASYLLISVYLDLENQQSERAQFYLEVTQYQADLGLGESKIGTINKGQIYTYNVESANSILTIRYFNTYISNCLILELGWKNSSISRFSRSGFQIIRKDEEIKKIYLKGKADACSYQISYFNSQSKIRKTQLSVPYSLSLEQNDSANFLYHHQNPHSFKIVQLIDSGQSAIYIRPFFKNSSIGLEQILHQDVTNFPIVDKTDGDYLVSNTSQHFCSQCFYYIVVRALSRVNEQILVVRVNDPIPLTVNNVIKEWLLPHTEIASETYLFYSLTSFEIIINIVYGKMRVTLFDYKSVVIFSENIQSSKNYNITTLTKEVAFEYYSSKLEYKIKVQAIVETEFYLKIQKQSNRLKLIEGFPIDWTSKNDNENATFEFCSSGNGNVTVILEARQGTQLNKFNLKVQGQSSQKSLILQKKVSQNNIVLTLENIPGNYLMQITAKSIISIQLLLLASNYTHLAPTHTYILEEQGLYQLFSQGRNVLIQIFSCGNQLEIKASKNYWAILEDKQTNDLLQITYPKYRNHHLLQLSKIYGQFYLRIRAKSNKAKIVYSLSYYFYNQEEGSPYKFIDDLTYDLQYKFDQNWNLQISASPFLKDSLFQANKSILYELYLGKSKSDLQRGAKCQLQNEIKGERSNTGKFNIDNKKLSIFTNNQAYLSLYAVVQVTFFDQSSSIQKYYPAALILYSNILQISVPKFITSKVVQYWFTNSLSLFLLALIVPFFLITSMIYFLIKCIFNRLVRNQKNMIEEENQGDNVGSQNKLGNDGNYTDTNAPVIKQQL